MWRKSFGKNTTSISKYKGIEHGEIEVERWVNRDNRKENLRIGKGNYRYVGKMELEPK